MSAPVIQRSPLLLADGWRDYQLLHCGFGMKQERWGRVNLVRPDPQVIWPKSDGPEWRGWDGFYHRSSEGGGRWEFRKQPPDHSEGMVKWCRENAALSGLAEAPVRYIVDDCLKFVRREIKRGRRYDAVIMDPPTYGRGAGGEMWKLEDSLWELLRECREILTPEPLFFLINAYTARLSPTVVVNLLGGLLADRGGRVTGGEVGLPIRADGRVLPCGIFGRWEAD